MVAGAAYPQILDLTWGEITEIIQCANEARRNRLRDDASMYFRSASLLCRMISAEKGTKFKVMDEYSFLWTDEERKEAKREELKRKLEAHSR